MSSEPVNTNENAEETAQETDSGAVVGMIATAFSGFVVGLGGGWLLWA